MRSKEQFRPEKKLRIACFHGFGTNGEMMKVQMRHLSRLMEPYAEFIFLDGSHITEKSLVVDPAVHKLIGEANSYSWFNYRNMSEPQLIEASVRHMEGLLEKHGPLDGMIGFSQGCAFVHLMLMALNEGMFRS